MKSIQFKGKENLAEVQAFLDQSNTRSVFRVREAFTHQGTVYPSVDLLEYEDAAGHWRVLTPSRWVGIDNGEVHQFPQQP